MTQTIKLKGGSAVVECLKQEGVRYVFGIPGGQNLAIMDALYDAAPDIQFITAHDERGAACMADGYARLTGKPGVCLVTTGPGATNLLTGVGGAFRDSSPVVLLTANNRSADLQRDNAQEADHVALFETLTKWSMMVTHVDRIPHAMREGFRRALTGCPGPVHLDFARENLEDEYVEYTPLRPEQYRTEARARGDVDAIARAAELLSKAERPAIWAGRGVLVSDATSAIVELAEALEVPMVTTYNGIGSLPADHRLAFGPKSRHGTKVTKQVVSDADLLLVIGNSLNAPTTHRWGVKLTENVVQIDIDPANVGRHYPIRIGIVGDAQSITMDLSAEVAKSAPSESVLAARRDWAERLRGEHRAWKESVFKSEYATAQPIKPQYLMESIREAFPREAIIVGGAGNPGIWTNLIEIYDPGTYIKPVGFGNMGFALPAAIGAKLACPQQPVVTVIGDGSLGMCISEIETAVRENAPVVIVLMNNFGYGNIKQEQLVFFGPRYIGVDFSDIQFVDIAKAFGADGERVENPGDLPAALKRGLDSGKTYLLDVLIDPDENVWTEPF